MEKDKLQKIAIRNKASPINHFDDFQDYNYIEFQLLFFTNIDGMKLQFESCEIYFNARY